MKHTTNNRSAKSILLAVLLLVSLALPLAACESEPAEPLGNVAPPVITTQAPGATDPSPTTKEPNATQEPSTGGINLGEVEF